MSISGFWKKDAARWPLWLPVALGLGAALYFALPAEPSAILGWAALALALAAMIAAVFGGPARIPLALLAALVLGFGMAKARQEEVAAPVLSRAMTLHLTGRVLAADPAAYGSRLVVGALRSGGFAGPPPGAARIAVRGLTDLHPGDGISLTARLLPPPGPCWVKITLTSSSRGVASSATRLARATEAVPPEALVKQT